MVVETSAGYVFGLTTFAPPPMHPRCDWNRKPNNYSAGTRPEIAAAALNAVLAGGGFSRTMGGDEEGNDTDGPPRTNVIVDPCCGGGTILHAAWSRGYHSIGGDVNAQIVRNAQGNIASFVPAMPAAHATLRGIDEAAGSRPLRSTLEKTRIGPRALARTARARAKPPGFSRRRRGSTRRTPRPHPRTGSRTPRIGSNATKRTST